jgi:putative spermidine/putrescine transport system permease protein
LSLRWFRAISGNPEFVSAFWASLQLGTLSATIAIIFTVPCALAVARYRFRGRDALVAFLQLPLMIPAAVLGIAFLRFFTEIGVSGTFLGLVLSHVIIVIPFCLRLVISASSGIDPRLEHAAISLGASWWTSFARVTLPLILPGIASGWVLAFITSFDEVTMTVFIASPQTTTLPVRLFLYIQDNVDPLVAAVSTALIGLTVVAMVLLDQLYGLERLLVGRGQS